jgi:hypothetical protein
MDGANPEGGWPYSKGKQRRLEPTCWALLALHDQVPAIDLARHLNFLRGSVGSEGLLHENPQYPVNFAFSALAAVTFRYLGALDAHRSVLRALTGFTGVTVPPTPVIRQDGSLHGWPWIEGTFSWVEPTSWALMALKSAAPDDRPSTAPMRIEEGERLLFDRMCRSGGWNYGNSAVFNQDLRPYVPTTALALLALQDRRDHPAVRASLDWLHRNQASEESGLALGLTAICLGVFGIPTDTVEARLRDQVTRTGFLGNLHVTATALFALDAARHGHEALRVQRV